MAAVLDAHTHFGAARDAQFHNAVHAADVVQAVYAMLHAAQVLPKLTELEIFAVAVAAAAHGACICGGARRATGVDSPN